MEEASLISKRLLGAAFSTTLAAIAFALPSTAAAATKIYSLRTASTQSIAALSPGSVGKGIVYSDGCTVQRVDVVPVTKTTTAPTVVVGAACNGTHAVRTTPATNLTAALGLDSLVAGTFNDDGLVIADKGRGFVDRYDAALGTLVTIAGNNGPNCATTAPPVDDSLAKDATLCNVSGLATHPSDASKFLLTDVAGAGASQGRGRVYLVSGTDRNTATIKTVAGSCNNAAATDALKLCITAPTDLFAGKGVVVFIDANTIALTTDSGLKTVSLTDGSVATVTTDGVTGLARGFSGDLYFSTTCQVKRYVIGTGTTTTVAGNGDCDPRARADGVPATQGAMGTIEALTSFHGGLLAGEFSSYQGTPSVIRFIDRLSFVSAPPPVFSPFRSLAISFEALDGNDSVWCALDAARSGGFTDPNCQSPFEQSNLADDNYSLRLSVDTVDSMPDIYPWTVDGTAPGAPVPTDPAPDGLVASARPLLKWTAAEDPAPPYFGQPMFGSGVDHYELLIDGKKDTDGACCETQPATALGEGSHTWQLRAVDKAGNTTAGETRTLRYGSPPVAALTISPNPALAGAVLTLNASTSSDAEGPIARYEFDLDNDGNYERDAGSSPTTTASFADPGTFTVGVRVTDGVANTATAKADVKVNAPLAAANLFGATINNGAQYTRDPNVVVSVKYPATISGLILSNDGGFLAPATFAAQKDVKWKLDSSGPERLPKIVYVRFQTGPIVSETYTDDIILDEIPPLVQKASVAPSAAGASIAKLRKYVVKVKATDSNSGVAKVQITRSKKKPGKLIAYTTKLTVRSAGRPKYLRAQDRAGNFSAWKKLR